ncbi:MAG: cohesin domain-containing protein [Acidobacteriota bacterium]|nr:cohesin domain-containing protein [Acidobacteriota bacterium]
MSSWRLLHVGLIVAGLTLGCGGGGGGGSPTTPPPPPPPPPPPSEGIFFTAEAMPGDNTIFLEGIDTTNTDARFVVEVRANELEDVYGVSFDLQYPTDLITWRRGNFSEGSFLNEGGSVETQILVDRRPSGNIVVGITRVGEEEGVSGSGVLLTLEFINEVVAGTGELTFSDNDVVNAAGDIDGDSQWLAGSVESKI